MIVRILAAAAMAFLLGCGAKEPAGPVKEYRLRGEIVKLDAEHRIASIKHENIEGFMDAMTMDFPVKDPQEYAKLSAGMKITARVQHRPSDNEYWIDQIQAQP